MTTANSLTPLERVLSLGADIKSGEGRNVALLFASLFLLLTTAYILKPVREMLILTEGSSEIRSYAVAAQAILLICIIPIYAHYSRCISRTRFMYTIVFFFATNFIIFAGLVYSGLAVSFYFFVWLGAYGVLIISQFWAFVSEQYNQKAGERLFALIAFGASIGAWFGAAISRWIVTHFQPAELMLVGTFTLIMSLVPILFLQKKPIGGAAHFNQQSNERPKSLNTLEAFRLVFANSYLLLLASFVILLNWLNSTGEYLLSSLVVEFYNEAFEAGEIAVTKEVYIGQFYSDFFLTVNIAGALVQFFLVSRIVNYMGLRVALLLTPLIVLSGYTLVALIPIIAIFKIVKIIENSLDYSLQNTVRQILYLPTTRREKYEARAVIDTFCWRFGDLLQALMVFVCLNIFAFSNKDFVYLQITLAAVFAGLAFIIGKRYRRLTEKERAGSNIPPSQTN